MNCAFVFVVWDNPKYLVGACAGAYSLKGTCHDIVLLYNNVEIPETAKEIFTHIKKVDLIVKNAGEMRTKKQREIYNKDFVNKVFTKFRCLELNYKKVLFVDSDIIFQQNVDHLMALSPPAATFTTPFTRRYGGTITDVYPDLRHGQRVDHTLIKKGLDEAIVGCGGLVLLSPEPGYPEFVKNFTMHAGYSGPDEQSICEFYTNRGVDFTNIHQMYQAIPWKPEWVKNPLNAPGLHYYHSKPYEIGDANGYEDTKIFWRLYNRFEREHPELGKALSKYITYREK